MYTRKACISKILSKRYVVQNTLGPLPFLFTKGRAASTVQQGTIEIEYKCSSLNGRKYIATLLLAVMQCRKGQQH